MRLTRRQLISAAGAYATVAKAATTKAHDATQTPERSAMNALTQIRQIDYTVIFARDMVAMRHFYETVMGFALERELGESWIEYRVGSNTLALTRYGTLFNDTPPSQGALSLQLAFRVSPVAVAECAKALAAKGLAPILPLTDQAWGHRTVFFRDPDGNVLEIFAEI